MSWKKRNKNKRKHSGLYYDIGKQVYEKGCPTCEVEWLDDESSDEQDRCDNCSRIHSEKSNNWKTDNWKIDKWRLDNGQLTTIQQCERNMRGITK